MCVHVGGLLVNGDLALQSKAEFLVVVEHQAFLPGPGLFLTIFGLAQNALQFWRLFARTWCLVVMLVRV